MHRLVLMFALIAAVWAGEAGGPKVPAEDDVEVDQKTEDSERVEYAQVYQWRRLHPPTPAIDAGAARWLEQARNLLIWKRAGGKGKEPDTSLEPYSFWRGPFDDRRRAAWMALDAVDEYPASALAPELVHLALEAYCDLREAYEVRRLLVRLWYAYPEHPRMGEAMRQALEVANKVQAFESKVDLDASEPSKVIRIDGSGYATDLNRLYRFLARYGDRESVAPQAMLGTARSYLILAAGSSLGSARTDVFDARRTYDQLLYDHPTHPLVFAVLCEQVLSHLLVYKGDEYDVGALIAAALIVDQAEREARGDQVKVAHVQRLRARIRGWHQDRDLAVARWYASKRGLEGLIGTPDGLKDWLDGARYYYREVIRRDPVSAQGRVAERELAALPVRKLAPLAPLPLDGGAK